MQLTPFTQKDFDNLYDFMYPLWHETYGNIIPKEQIDFLLDKYFSKSGLAYYRAEGYQYRNIDDIGVVVYVDRGDHTYMDKLYLLPCARGKNYPAFVFDYLLSLGKDVVLSVNQKNERAYRCYLKNGFVVEKEQILHFSATMVNRDFILRKKYVQREPAPSH